MQFRDLTADDIEVRVQSVKLNPDKTPKGLVLLLYKNARVDMNILDETVGPEKWQREHYECKGNLFCKVGIKITEKEIDATTGLSYVAADEWVWKSDCGTESNTEAQKGEASDSFKRACFNWGIGRELYTSPFIWVPADKCNIRDGKCYDNFEVEKIIIDDKKINAISIMNTSKGQRCFVWQRQ